MNNNRATQHHILIAVALLIIMISAVPMIRTSVIGTALNFYTPLADIQHTFAHIPASVRALFTSEHSSTEENQILQARIMRLERTIAYQEEMIRDLKEIHNSLQELFPNTATTRQRNSSIVSQPIPTPDVSPFDSILINKGKDNGVEKGMSAIIPGNVFIGHVTEVFDTRSRITLTSSFDTETPLILAKNNTTIFSRGAGSGSFVFDIPRDFAISIGDRVLYRENNTFLAGFVEEIQQKEAHATIQVRASISFNPYHLSFIILVP